MKNLLTLIAAFCLTITAFSQTNTPTPPPTFGDAITSLFDVHDTNSLINAKELNVTPVAIWDSKNESLGGGVKLDWWVTDQQGAFLRYDEFSGRTGYLSTGYQMRTVFSSVEVSLGVGIKQNTEDALGESMTGFLTPQLTYRIIKKKDWDVRLTAGADIATAGKPMPFVGLTFRATRM